MTHVLLTEHDGCAGTDNFQVWATGRKYSKELKAVVFQIRLPNLNPCLTTFWLCDREQLT